MDIATALLFGWPGKAFSVGETYESLVWLDDSPKPTLEAIIEAWAAYSIHRNRFVYREQRRNQYPSIEDICVALWEKVIEDRPDSAEALQLIRMQIKNEFPKP